MINELREFRDLVDKADNYKSGRGVPPPPDEDEIARCLQIMLAKQCIYPWQQQITRAHEIMSTHEYQDFFRKYFSALGLEFYHDTRSGMIALKVPDEKTRFDWQSARLKKDETCVLLVLRLIFDEEAKRGKFDDRGRVITSTNDLFDKLQVIAHVEIAETRLMDILGNFRRKGLVDIGERDPVDKVVEVNILPGIEIAVTPAYIQRFVMRLESADFVAPDISLLISDLAMTSDEPEDAVRSTEELENV
jgi:hypothetical protein